MLTCISRFRPDDVLTNPSLLLNTTYYVTKQILPPLDRALSLLGVNVFQWYSQLPRTQRSLAPPPPLISTKRGTISQYFQSMHCPVCEEITNEGVCSECAREPDRVVVTLTSRINRRERDYLELCQVMLVIYSSVNLFL